MISQLSLYGLKPLYEFRFCRQFC